MGTVRINSITINNASGTGGHGPFSGNKTITSIDLGQVNWTSSTLSNAFMGCSNLTTITNFPNTIESLVGGTFYRCSSLATLPKLPDSIKSIYSGGWSVTPFKNTPINNTDFLPNSVEILDYCFHSCNSLTTINYLPNSIKSLYWTFREDYYLTTVLELPTACAYYQNTFMSCRNLTTIPPIPYGAVNMSATFSGCTQLTDIYILSTHVNNAYYCFNGTSIQKNVYIPYNDSLGIYTTTYNTFNSVYGAGQNGVQLKENPYFETYGDWWWCNYDGVIHKYLGLTTPSALPNSINGKATSLDGCDAFAVGNHSFYNGNTIVDLYLNNTKIINSLYEFCYNCQNLVNIHDLNVDNSVTNMCEAFRYCYSLKEVSNLPNSIVDMSMTFYNCRALVNTPTIPNSVTNMYATFYECETLTTAPTIPENVTNISIAFYNCNALTGNIYIKSNKITNAHYCFPNNSTYRKNVYIPFKNSDGTNSATYNSFTVEGYKTDGSYQNVYLKDLATL